MWFSVGAEMFQRLPESAESSRDIFPLTLVSDDRVFIGTLGIVAGFDRRGNLLGERWPQRTNVAERRPSAADRNLGTIAGRHPNAKGMDHGNCWPRPRDAPHERSSDRMAPLSLFHQPQRHRHD